MTARYGPFHRQERSTAIARLIAETGELWGRAPLGSDMPQVQAWVGPLPRGKRGIEFLTDVSPTPGTPPHEARWRPDGVSVRLTTDGDYAVIDVVVTRNAQV